MRLYTIFSILLRQFLQLRLHPWRKTTSRPLSQRLNNTIYTLQQPLSPLIPGQPPSPLNLHLPSCLRAPILKRLP